MFLSTYLLKMLFGRDIELKKEKWDRRSSFNFPAKESGDKDRRIEYPTDDGLILYLLKRIEKIEEKVSFLESKKSSSPPR